MFKSIRGRLIIVYFTLVLIALLIVGVFITDRLEAYHMDLARSTLTDISKNWVKTIIPDDRSIDSSQDQIQRELGKIRLPADYEVSILDASTYRIIASSNPDFIEKNGPQALNPDVLLGVMNQGSYELNTAGRNSSSKIKNLAFYYPNAGGYIIYGRAYLDNVYRTLNESTMIFIQATLIALGITILLGFLISSSITTPINDLKDRAIKIARGDFSQRTPVKSQDEIGQLASTFNFLTERLDHTLMEISSEKNKLDAIINHMTDGLLAVDDNGQIIHFNAGFLRLFPLSTPSLPKMTFDELSKNLELGTTLETLTSSKNEASYLTVHSKDDQILKISLAPFTNTTKTLGGYVLLFQDVTESTHLEEMRRDFVANVSHELKTPVTTIKTYAETLAMDDSVDKDLSMEFIHVIESEADRMAALIRDLLQLSHLDHNKVQWNFQKRSASILLQDSMTKMRLYYEEKDQQMQLNLPEEDIFIFVDPSKFQQVLVNILSNAIKYTATGGIIHLSLTKEKDQALFTIQDNGIGIPEKDLPHIFERFYRVDKGRSRSQGGTGLGLSIAQNILEEHGGSIQVKSRLGQGTAFFIRVPLCPEAFSPLTENL